MLSELLTFKFKHLEKFEHFWQGTYCENKQISNSIFSVNKITAGATQFITIFWTGGIFFSIDGTVCRIDEFFLLP